MSNTHQTKDSDKSNKKMRDDVNPLLLEVLVCPITKQPLVLDRSANELISAKANLAFPIRDGIPIMLIEEARELTNE